MTSAVERLNAGLRDRYSVEREIGAGGMAIVYLAHDVRHDRKVAVKVLRPTMAAVIGPERFLHEIRTTANLQHPHILPLHDSGTVDGTVFYVMPFVAGESLRDRLTREKQLPVADAIRIATEVANALDYAHRHGIIHRDIKPENILLHDGQALVADFGIALAATTAGGSRMTDSGLSLGTPHYMSPEQAMGNRSLDGRTDVYALGCVMYEMLVGDPPFTGPNAQAITAKVLSEKPAPIRAFRDTVPDQVEAAVRSALARLPADRFATAGAFAAALAETGTATQLGPRSNLRWKWVAGILTLALAGTTMIVVWGWLQLDDGGRRPVSRYAIALPQDQSLLPGRAPRMALSPDGARFVYTGPGEEGGQLWLRERDELRATPIPGTRGAAQPVFSPDGKQVAFITFAPTPALNVVTLGGGPPVSVATVAGSTIESGGVAWGGDGYLYATGPGGGLVRVPAGGGSLQSVTVLDTARGETKHLWPDLLPGGRYVLFTIRTAADQNDVAVADLRTRHHRTLVPAGSVVSARSGALARSVGSFARYAASGHLVYVAGGVLSAVPFDPARAEMTGPAIPLVEGVSGSGASDLALSQSGTLLYVSVPWRDQGLSEVVRVTRNGAAEVIDRAWPPAEVWDPALSPDGTRLALRVNTGGQADVWIKQLNRGPLSRLTFGSATTGGNPDTRPEWTANGRVVTFISGQNGRKALWEQRADGGAEPRLLYASERNIAEAFASPDGSWIVYRTNLQDPGRADILAIRPGVDSAPWTLVATESEEVTPALSPDGRWLAYVSNESGRSEVYVRPFPNAAAAKWQVSTAEGQEPVWAHSGSELFYRNGAGHLVAVGIRTSPAFAIRDERVLFSMAPYRTEDSHQQYAVFPDDKSFLIIRPLIGPAEGELIVVENWLEELKRKMIK